MAEAAPQNYSNHVVFPTKLVVVTVIFLASAIMAIAGLAMPNSTAGHCLMGTGLLLNSLAAIFGLLLMRNYAVTLQDRIIRTEMRIRLAAVLPEELKGPAKKLTVKQLVGLRFASDEELPDLARKVLDENIAKADAIKKLITHWQADHQRV
jgi:hypothetical protein